MTIHTTTAGRTAAPAGAAAAAPAGTPAGAPAGAEAGAAAGAAAGAPRAVRSRGALRLGLLTAPVAVLLALLSLLHLLQGTSELSPAEVWQALTGTLTGSTAEASAVIIDARLPRLFAGLAVGAALGLSGGILQSITRNSLASPDTLGVNAGAYFALTAVAAFGVSLPFFSSAGVAFAGGLLAAGLVIGLSTGPHSSPIRMVLAGSVIALGLAALTSMLLLFFPWQTQGLFAWGAGSLSQAGIQGVITLLPVLASAAAALLLFGRRLDALQLGDDAATSLGVRVRAWQAVFLVIAVVCTAVAVTIAGPVGFVGLCAPALTRLLVGFFPGLTRQRSLIVVSALLGAFLVIGADVLMRALLGSQNGVSVPTGVVTSIIGAVFLATLACTARSGFDSDSLVTMRAGTGFGLRHPVLLITICAGLLMAVIAGSVLVGDAMLLGGDVVNWLTDQASVRIEIILETRVPRVFAAVLGGLSLALAGAILQGVTRNPLADPGVLGISAAAATGAVAAIVITGTTSFWAILCAALTGASAVGLVLFGISARTGLDHARMVLAGISISAAAAALTTLMLVHTDPWNQTKAMTWLAGSTYGATAVECLPMIIAIVVTGAVLSAVSRDLDLVQMDDTTPQVLGVHVGRTRSVLVACALVLVAAATISVGTIAFLGLVAPHAARLLIGRTHRHLLPLTGLLGALLLTIADAIGRTVIAPSQIPAGLITAVIGCPYFIWLLWRMRRS